MLVELDRTSEPTRPKKVTDSNAARRQESKQTMIDEHVAIATLYPAGVTRDMGS